MGYFYRYHRPGVDQLPRIPECREPLFRPKSKVYLYFTIIFLFCKFKIRFVMHGDQVKQDLAKVITLIYLEMAKSILLNFYTMSLVGCADFPVNIRRMNLSSWSTIGIYTNQNWNKMLLTNGINSRKGSNIYFNTTIIGNRMSCVMNAKWDYGNKNRTISSKISKDAHIKILFRLY